MSQRESPVKSILIALVTAILVSIFNYFIWTRQNSTEQEQEHYKYKVQLMERYTNSTLKMISLANYQDKFRIENNKYLTKLRDSLKIGNGYLPSKYDFQAMKITAKKFPEEYAKFTEYLSYDDEHLTNCILVKMFFSDSIVDSSVSSVQKSFDQSVIHNYIQNYMITRKVKFDDIDDRRIIQEIADMRYKTLLYSVDKLKREINPTKPK